jgi:hypothetical protein
VNGISNVNVYESVCTRPLEPVGGLCSTTCGVILLVMFGNADIACGCRGNNGQV